MLVLKMQNHLLNGPKSKSEICNARERGKMRLRIGTGTSQIWLPEVTNPVNYPQRLSFFTKICFYTESKER